MHQSSLSALRLALLAYQLPATATLMAAASVWSRSIAVDEAVREAARLAAAVVPKSGGATFGITFEGVSQPVIDLSFVRLADAWRLVLWPLVPFAVACGLGLLLIGLSGRSRSSWPALPTLAILVPPAVLVLSAINDQGLAAPFLAAAPAFTLTTFLIAVAARRYARPRPVTGITVDRLWLRLATLASPMAIAMAFAYWPLVSFWGNVSFYSVTEQGFMAWVIDAGATRLLIGAGIALWFALASIWIARRVTNRDLRRHPEAALEREGRCLRCGYPTGETEMCTECGGSTTHDRVLAVWPPGLGHPTAFRRRSLAAALVLAAALLVCAPLVVGIGAALLRPIL